MTRQAVRESSTAPVRRSSRLAALATHTAGDGETTTTAAAARTSTTAPVSRQGSLRARRRSTRPLRAAALPTLDRQQGQDRDEAKRKREDDDGSDYEQPNKERRTTTTRRRSSKRTKQEVAEDKGKGKEKVQDERPQEEGKGTTSSTAGDTSAAAAADTVAAPVPDCSICFDAVKVQGLLNSCDHPFCFECISTWAEKANVCPLCKRRFTSITKQALGVVQTPSRGRRGASTRKRAPEKVRVRKRDYRFTESDEEFYYREFLEDQEEEDDEEDDDEHDGFIASDDEWWGQEFRPGLIFERVLAARGRFHEIVITDDDGGDVDNEDSLLSPADYEADAAEEDDEDRDFQRQIAEATRLSLLDQTHDPSTRDDAETTAPAAATPEQRRAGASPSTTDSARSRRRPRVSIIDLTGLDAASVADGEESSLSPPDVDHRRPEAQAEPTDRRSRRQRRTNEEEEEDDDDVEVVAPSRRRRTRRRLVVEDEEEEPTTTTTTTTTSTSTSTATRTRSSRARRTGGGRRGGSSARSSTSAVSTDDSWLNEGLD